LRKIENGTVSTFAGTPGSAGDANGPLLQAKFNSPTCLVFTQPAMFYIGDEGNELIRAIDLTQNSLPLTLSTSTGATTFCTGTAATLTATPSGLTTYIFKDGANIIATNGTGVLSLASLSAGSHSISCTATGNSGSYASLSAFSVTIIGASTASVMPAGPVSICNGSPVMLTASAGTSYQWSNGATTPSISVNQPGNYNVTVTYTAGCTSQSNVVTVVAGGNFSATITPANPPSICAGDSILLAASNGVSYLWSNGKTTQYIYVNTPGNYAVTVTNNSGCTATSSVVSLVVNTLPVASVIPAGPVTIMQGQTITLTANAASGYLWSTGATTASIAVSQPGTYWVKVRNAADCYSAPVSVVVNVNPITSVNITAYGDTIICPGDSVQLTSSSFFGNQWYKNNVAIPLATFQTYYAKDAGIYTVSVLVGNTTLISNPITIALKSVPATLDVTGDTICSGGAAELSLVPEAGVIYQWYEQPTGGNYIAVGYTLTISELYQTTVYYINQIANGCSSLQRIPITAYVWPSLGLSFNASEAVKELTGFRVQFQNNTPDQNLLWNWDFGDGMSGSVSSDAQPVYVYAAEGTYAVTLTASNSRGCSESFTKMIEVGVAHDLFLPSAFTPNNDGVNDIFRLKGSGFTAATMSILNQWSQLIFKTDHAASGWDGQVKGALAPNGTYVYVVKITLPDGKEKVMKGNISLIK
jgi:gliding motility-associated-like protein